MANLEPTQSSADVLGDKVESESSRDGDDVGGQDDSGDAIVESDGNVEDAMSDTMDVQADTLGDHGEDMMLGEADQSAGKRVKVYELRDQAWFDRGTGHCKGVYDDQNDVALLIVEAEVEERQGGEGPGGFLKDELLLNTQVTKEDQYARQQETLIVWTDQVTQQDIALSFQDPEGCEDIWQFIIEVQKHLSNQLGDELKLAMASSSSPLSASPLLGAGSALGVIGRDHWQAPSLANIKEHEMWLRMQAKSAAGRERAVEHIVGEDYIKQLIGVLNQAEDLESINDLHALCSLMQTILMFNDNGIFEYILQDDIFMGVLGMLEYDPEFPTLKASYRAFFRQFSKYRQVVEIKDETIRNKIHQTSRLLYLKDVVLARMLDDPTFGILNSFVFFNQVDITTYIQNDEGLLRELFVDFEPQAKEGDPARDPRKHDLVLFLHQLMLMGKGVQLQNRLALYRTLLDHGLLLACEWAFRQREATILHAGAEILTLAVEHDVNSVRLHTLREEELARRSLVVEMVALIQTTADQGLLQQLAETLKTLLEPTSENEQAFGRQKDVPVADTFIQHFYDRCALPLLAPLDDLPDVTETGTVPLLAMLVDLLTFCMTVHTHCGQYWLMANPINVKVVPLLCAREKTLRHTALRFFKSCLKVNNVFLHRNMIKDGAVQAMVELVERETVRDNMLSSACLDTLELIRKDNNKVIIADMFETHEATMSRLAERPFVRSYVLGLRVRWEQNKEQPPPPPPQPLLETRQRSEAEEEEAWFNQSDEEDGPVAVPAKRKRPQRPKRSPAKPFLGLDYDDASDSESDGAEVPEALAEELTDVEEKVRAKRLREDEEEEALDVLGTKGLKGARKGATSVAALARTVGAGAGETSESKEKKIRLTFGLGKRL